ncbi:TKL/TKL-ccin protein kinase [Ephemerocybe angulata]|uniref:TKL/TKL-ccin protein kinase n=1 Tax=Ephemerocybe angulata TaxID=980116 RepID=A0A8H6I6U1_9AGAR|nr:TKL/TKL-ccin protein kinase [Tulosesus angulatus]
MAHKSSQQSAPRKKSHLDTANYSGSEIEPYNPDPAFDYFTYGPYTDIAYGRTKRTKTRVLVKVWRLRVRDDYKGAQNVTKALRRALKTWDRAARTCPNISPFLGLTEGFNQALPSLAMNRYKEGNASEYLRKHTELDPYPLVHAIANAVHFLHTQSPPIIHGSLWGNNILISDQGSPLLTDIGLWRLETHPIIYSEHDSLHKSRWMASELIDPRITEVDGGVINEPDTRSDVYSFGMTALELLTRRPPFSHFKRSVVVIGAVSQGKRPLRHTCPEVEYDEVWRILESCWEHYPSRRPSIGTVCLQLNVFAASGKKRWCCGRSA